MDYCWKTAKFLMKCSRNIRLQPKKLQQLRTEWRSLDPGDRERIRGAVDDRRTLVHEMLSDDDIRDLERG